MKNVVLAVSVLGALCGFGLPANAIVYQINRPDLNPAEFFDPIGFVGQIETDGTQGVLSRSNIVSMDISVSGASFNLSNLGFLSMFASPNELFYAPGQNSTRIMSIGFDDVSNLTRVEVEIFDAGSDLVAITLALSEPIFDSVTGEVLFFDQFFFSGDAEPYQTGGFLFGTPQTAAVPLPAALPLMATGLVALGVLGLRRRRFS